MTCKLTAKRYKLTSIPANVHESVSVVSRPVGRAVSVLRSRFQRSLDSPTQALTLYQAFPLVFGNNHGFNLWQTGLTFLGLFVGNVIGVSCDPFWRRNCTCDLAERKSELLN